MKKKKLVECKAVGCWVSEDSARYLDDVVKGLPKDSAYRPRTKLIAEDAEEIISDERTDVATITTDAVDLEQEIILPEGVDLEAYQKTMTVLFNHDRDKQIGTCLWVRKVPHRIKAKTFYTPRPNDWPEGTEWLPDYVWSMVRSKTMKGKSVGIIPTEIRELTTEEKGIEAYAGAQLVIPTSVMYEFSTVTCPANPEALIEQVKNIDLSGAKILYRPGQKRKPVYGPMSRDIDRIDFDLNDIIKQVIDNVINAGRV